MRFQVLTRLPACLEHRSVECTFLKQREHVTCTQNNSFGCSQCNLCPCSTHTCCMNHLESCPGPLRLVCPTVCNGRGSHDCWTGTVASLEVIERAISRRSLAGATTGDQVRKKSWLLSTMSHNELSLAGATENPAASRSAAAETEIVGRDCNFVCAREFSCTAQ